MKSKITSILAIVVFVLSSFTISAQEKTITGTVKGADDGLTMPGVSIVIVGSQTGTSTDFDGNYEITVNEGDVIQFNFMGYSDATATIGSSNTYNVVMLVDSQQLEDVVVTALGIKREKKALGYAVQDIKSGELTEGGNSNVIGALSGKIAGVQITSASGSVGGSSVIKIRGNKSFKGNTSPLFVVDGVPISNTTSTSSVDYGNAAADIDPENIESMSVLKGASAAALYGSRGANGVILITTKKGTKRKGIGVTFSSSISFDEVYILPNYQNDYGQGVRGSEYEHTLSGSSSEYKDWAASQWSWTPDDTDDESFGARLDAGVKTIQFDSNGVPAEMISRPNNVKDFYEIGISKVNSIALSGGNETAQGRLIITHTDQTGTTPNTDQQKLNIGFNSSVKMTDFLKFEINGNYNITSNDNLASQGGSTKNPLYEFNNWFGRQVDMNYLKDHYLDYVTHADGSKSRSNWMTGYDAYNNNVYWNMNMNLNSRERQRMFGSFSATYTIAEGFDLVARAGTDNINENRKSNLHSDTKGRLVVQSNPVNGSFTETVRSESETNADLMLNIAKDLTEDISLHSTIGANYRHNKSQNMYIGVPNLVVPDFYSTSAADGNIVGSKSMWEKESNSLFGSVNLGYKNYLYLDLTYRQDWSSTLPKENRSYGYPSSTLGFIFSDALNLKNDIFSYGKIRGSYAEVGTDTSPYSTNAIYTPYGSSPWVNGTVGDANFYRLSSVLPSSDLRPERTKSFEFGTELKFFNNKLGLDLTYYNATTHDQLMNVRLAPSSGYYTWKKNAGSMQNSGIEIQLYATLIETDNFSWNINVNYAKNNNKIIELDGEIEELEINGFNPAPSSIDGVTLWARKGQEWGTIEGRVRKTNDNGDFLLDETGSYILTKDPIKIGSVNPDFIGGIRNSLNYKGISFSFLIDFKIGGDIYSATKVQGQRSGILQATVEDGQRETGYLVKGLYDDGTIINGVDVSGTESEKTILPRDFWTASRYYTEMGLIDGSYVKLREINLSYRFPSSLIKKIHLQSATFSVFARNIALLYTHESNDVGIDPEVAGSGSVLDTGYENFNLAPSRTIGAKLSINF